MAVERHRINRRHRTDQTSYSQQVRVRKGRGRTGLASGFAVMGAADEKWLGPFALRVAVIAAFTDDVHLLPGKQANIVGDEFIGYGIPAQPVGVAEAVRVDFLLQAGQAQRDKWIGVGTSSRNTVTAIGAERVG